MGRAKQEIDIWFECNKNYFREKSEEYQIPESDEYFTDVDAYQGNYQENDSTATPDSRYAGWGEENNDN